MTREDSRVVRIYRGGTPSTPSPSRVRTPPGAPGGPLPFPFSGLCLLLLRPIGEPAARRRTPEPCPRRARSPSDSQRPPPRGARAVAMATPPLADRVAVLSREGRPPEVGGDPEVASPQSWSVRSTPPEVPVRPPLRGLPLRDRQWTVRGCHPSGRGRGSGGRPRPRPRPPISGSPALLSVRPAPHQSPVPARDVGIWGSGLSGHSAPEKEAVAPLPQNPSQGGGSAPGLPHGRSQAAGDALTVRWGPGGGAGAGAPALPSPVAAALPAGPLRAQGTKETSQRWREAAHICWGV